MSFFTVTTTYTFPAFFKDASEELKAGFMEVMKSVDEAKRTEFFKLFETVEREYGVNPCRFVCKYGLDKQSATAYRLSSAFSFTSLNVCGST